MLYLNKNRTRLTPMKQGELEYEYYDTSARPPFAVYRELVNGWIANLPERDRDEIIARFRSKSISYGATLSELMLHEAILGQGFATELHPQGSHPSNRLDFKVFGPGGKVVALVEATSIALAKETIAHNNREARIYNAVDAIELPAGWRLSYRLQVAGLDSPPTGPLRRDIKQWAQEVAASNDASTLHKRIFIAGDWEIELTLLGGFDPESDDRRAIAGAMGQIRLLEPHYKIRHALELKGDKYGALDAPYLIVIADCRDELPGNEHNAISLLEAVFGTESVKFVLQANGETVTREERLHDGYWGIEGAAKNANVSAVMLLPKPNLWHLRDERHQPIIVHNPWATHPWPRDVFPLPSFNIDEAGSISLTSGKSFADLIGLPEEWPPEG